MLSARTCLIFLVCAMFVGCHRLSPTEEKVVGTWEFTGMDATLRFKFNRDHTLQGIDTDPESRGRVVTRGTWRLEGNNLVTEEQLVMLGGEPPPPKKVIRIPISEFREDELICKEGAPYKRVK